MSDGPRTGYALPSDPLNELGDPADSFRGPAQLFMRTLVTVIRTQFGQFVNRNTAVPFFHLQSPGGKTFRVSVADDGTLKVENARG